MKERDRIDNKMLHSKGQQIVTGKQSQRIDSVWREFLQQYNEAHEEISNEAFTPARVCDPCDDERTDEGNGCKHVYVYDTIDRIIL
jgi:hypothetical protein